VPAGLGAVSPDGKMLAFNLLQTKTESGVNPYSQVWLLDLVSKQIIKLVETGSVGSGQVVWSPDRKMLAYQLFSSNGFLEEVRIIGVDGQNERSLLKNQDLLGYYWIDSAHMGLIRTDSVDQVDLTGKVVDREVVDLPTGKTEPTDFQPKPKVAGLPQGIVTVIENGNLIVISQNGQTTTIGDEKGWWINDFELAPDGKQIAYATSNGPEEVFWISDLSGDKRRKLFERIDKERGHIGPIF
jgi:Tol biopolymer transport system component